MQQRETNNYYPGAGACEVKPRLAFLIVLVN